MNTITNEQIKQAFERPELLRDLFPNAFKLNLEKGKWYYITSGHLNTLFNFSGDFDTFNNPKGYGISYVDKGWMIDDAIGWTYDTIRPATTEEVESFLIEEAEKRGYCDAKNIDGYKYTTAQTYFYRKLSNVLYKGTKTGANISVFQNGRWAEIVKETEIELTLDEIAKKFGVDKVKIKK